MIVVTATVWPHGQAPDSSHGRAVAERGSLDLVSLVIVNNGTGHSTGPDEGGVGMYDVFRGDPLERSTWRHLGTLGPIERTPAHRVGLVMAALELADFDPCRAGTCDHDDGPTEAELDEAANMAAGERPFA